MGVEYFACDVGKTTAWWDSAYAAGRPNPHGGWIATYKKNFTTVAPARAHKWYVKGYAEKIRQVPGADPVRPNTSSRIEFKTKSSSHGKKWTNRHKNGLILVTPWSAHQVDIIRKVEPELIVSSVPQTKLQFQDRFNQTNQWYGEYPGKPYYWVNGQWSWHRVGSYKYISEADVSDVQIFSSLRLAPEFNEATITAALAEANQGYFDLLTELAELPETISYLYGILNQAKEATLATYKKEVRYKQMFKRKLMTAAQLATALASLWLQYRYAISPIICSLEDIQYTLGAYSKLFKTARGSDRVAGDVIPPTLGGLSLVGYSGGITDRVFIKRSYSAEGLVDGLLRNLSLNPFSTAWELVPLSFVVDWFINIGDTISAFTGPNVHIEQVSSISRKCEYIVTYKDTTGASLDVKVRSYVRDKFNPLDHSGLSFDPDITWKRTLDALALSWSFTKDDWMKQIKKLR